MNKLLFLLTAMLLITPVPALRADDPPAGGGNRDQGTVGGDAGGARLGESDRGIENALRGQGIISGGGTNTGTNAGATVGTSGPGQTSTRTETTDSGGTRTVITGPDGSRTVTETGRGVEPATLSITFNKDGSVVSQNSQHTNGTVDTMTYNPATGVRESTSVQPDGATTRSVSQRDGSGVITQTGFNPNTQVTEEDAQGHVTETTSRPDGTKTVVTFTRIQGDPYATRGEPVTHTTTDYNAAGKPTRQVRETNERYGRGYRQTRREVTEYDSRGKPKKTTVSQPRQGYGDLLVREEVEYWHNGFRKVIKRRDESGRITEVYYYDHLGHLTRSSIQPGHTAGAEPTTGTFFQPQNDNRQSAVPTQREDAFARADSAGSSTPGLDGLGGTLARELVNRPVPDRRESNENE
ncbi:MAG: hypothetical protein Q8R76_11045 [Candidatus Omnitrophota bacterium]|nr:hypothetical protein [Candidatus Omnitrophota bacterium]